MKTILSVSIGIGGATAIAGCYSCAMSNKRQQEQERQQQLEEITKIRESTEIVSTICGIVAVWRSSLQIESVPVRNRLMQPKPTPSPNSIIENLCALQRQSCRQAVANAISGATNTHIITGHSGVGKTNMIANHLTKISAPSAIISVPRSANVNVFDLIATEFDIQPPNEEADEFLTKLEHLLGVLPGTKPVLVIDNLQNIPELEDVCRLCDWACGSESANVVVVLPYGKTFTSVARLRPDLMNHTHAVVEMTDATLGAEALGVTTEFYQSCVSGMPSAMNITSQSLQSGMSTNAVERMMWGAGSALLHAHGLNNNNNKHVEVWNLLKRIIDSSSIPASEVINTDEEVSEKLTEMINSGFLLQTIDSTIVIHPPAKYAVVRQVGLRESPERQMFDRRH